MTCMPRQMPSTGRPARCDAAASASSRASRSGRASWTRGCGAAPYRLGVDVRAAGEDEPVQALEQRRGEVRRRRPAAAGPAATMRSGSLDVPDVVVRQQRRWAGRSSRPREAGST